MNLHDGEDSGRPDHTHQCETCGDEYPCGGPTERNHDSGGGDWICLSHYRGMIECEVCHQSVKCAWCGIVIALGVRFYRVDGATDGDPACDEECLDMLKREHWTPAEVLVAINKFAAWKDAKAAERTRQASVKRTDMETGLCCMARHANAKAPWTCDCPCHDQPVDDAAMADEDCPI